MCHGRNGREQFSEILNLDQLVRGPLIIYNNKDYVILLMISVMEGISSVPQPTNKCLVACKNVKYWNK